MGKAQTWVPNGLDLLPASPFTSQVRGAANYPKLVEHCFCICKVALILSQAYLFHRAVLKHQRRKCIWKHFVACQTNERCLVLKPPSLTFLIKGGRAWKTKDLLHAYCVQEMWLLSRAILLTFLWGRQYVPHIRDEEMEVQRGWPTCLDHKIDLESSVKLVLGHHGAGSVCNTRTSSFTKQKMIVSCDTVKYVLPEGRLFETYFQYIHSSLGPPNFKLRSKQNPFSLV